ncbi:MAG: glycoside hydrolase family 95 protein, partial [Clostridia bacterium]|nr:glycoside hydrolase family 95 protein [Clostridia bacterium]
VNSTMDLAIIKELFTNLIELCVEHNIYGEKLKIWENIVNSIPEYGVNKDGAVREWQNDNFEDRYYHRHLSHIYPVFPGDEITTNDDMVSAFEKAVDLRDISAQTGWSQAHMASIYARFNRGNDAMDCLNNLVRSCMQTNFFTLHNDWRRMDLSLEMDSAAPIQLDASMGYVNAVQEMILYSSKKLIKLLPALSDNMQRGKITGWRFEGGIIDMEWDLVNSKFKAELTAVQDFNKKIELPNFCVKNFASDNAKFNIINGNTVEIELKKGNSLSIYTVIE